MLSMVNANRFIRMGAIPLVLVAYAVFIWIDHHTPAESDVKVAIQNVKNSRSVDGLIFGGSNAIYGLSAEYLSYHMGLNWYNASLEGEIHKELKNFVQELSTWIDHTKVRYVVYSSIFAYEAWQLGSPQSRNRKRERGEGIKPRRSVLGDITQRILGQRETQRNSFGDLVFESVECAHTLSVYHREEEDTAADFLVDKVIFFASVFPNASILIVMPSRYYGAASFDGSIFEKNLRTKFYGLLRQKYHFEGTVKIIFQPPYSSITQVCDGPYYANEDGRVWRTENLIESIQPAISRRAFVHGQVNHQ
jgi:hypothetical protein